jgi:hypothetical protein
VRVLKGDRDGRCKLAVVEILEFHPFETLSRKHPLIDAEAPFRGQVVAIKASLKFDGVDSAFVIFRQEIASVPDQVEL